MGAVPLRNAAGDDVTKTGPAFLCRCGQSRNKPFCDGSHKRVGFDGTEAASRGRDRGARRGARRAGSWTRRSRPPAAGPTGLRGERAASSPLDGERYERRNRQTLCRCGQSQHKPFCDGSHVHAGFTDPA